MRWRASRSSDSSPFFPPRVLVATNDFVAVGFNVPVAEFIAEKNLGRHEELRRLGPDLLADVFDESDALQRLGGRLTDIIADVLLDQRVMAGIGNVYKSEVLFTCGVNPFARVTDLDDEARRCLITTARRLLVANVNTTLAPMTTYTGYRRTTRRDNPRDRLWVYGRAGLPCRRCATPTRLQKLGPQARLTYWCPTCQT